jgi:protein-tyrosine phosphatase
MKKLIRLTESELHSIIRESVRMVLKNSINEINHIASNTDITVCGVEDFINICKNFPTADGSTIVLNDQNVEDLYGEYAFIEIRDSIGRVKTEFPLTRFYKGGDVDAERDEYFNKLWYFQSDHSNVLRLEYDDTQSFGEQPNGYTAAVVSLDRLNDGLKFNKKGEPRRKPYHFSYLDGRDFDDEMANRVNNFISDNIERNPYVKFIIHCRAGASRSAGIGTFVAKIKEEIYQDKEYAEKFFREHVIDDGSPQFDIGASRKGERVNIKLPHQKEMKRLGSLRGWNKYTDDTYNQWYIDNFLNSGFYNEEDLAILRDRQLKAREKNKRK